jgi:hypothetical protein
LFSVSLEIQKKNLHVGLPLMFYSSSAIVSAWWELQHLAVQHQTIPKTKRKKKEKR